MTTASALPREPLGPGASAALGVVIVLGWTGFDLTILLTSGSPDLILRMLPGMLLSAVAGAAVGGLLALHRALPVVALLATGLAAAATGLPEKFLTAHHAWFVRAVFLILLIHWTSGFAYRRWGFGWVRSGAALGFLAAVAIALQLKVDRRFVWPIANGAVLISLAVGFVRHAGVRRGVTVTAMVTLIVAILYNASLLPGVTRPDLPPREPQRARGPSLVLIVIDTLRADHLSCYGYERETSPSLDAFAAESATLFTQARSTSSWTLPAHASLLTGLYPAQHGATATRGELNELTSRSTTWPCQPIDPEAPRLADALYQRGYRTGAVVGNAFNVRANFGFGVGFERFDDLHGMYTMGHRTLTQMAGQHLSVGGLAYRDAIQVADSALDWLDGVGDDEAFFLFLNFMDPHDPYLPHDGVREAFSEHQPQNARDPTEEEVPLLYDREILAVDQQIGRLFDALRARGSFEDTVIVVTSDHGEGLGQHGNDFHSWSLYEELLHVPLLVKPAGPRAAAVNDEPLSLVDVHDLMLRELGLEPPTRAEVDHVAEWYRGLWNNTAQLENRERRMQQPLDRDLIAWLDGRTKYIVGSNGSVEAYDLDADPRELSALELTEPQLRAALDRAQAWWMAHPPPVVVKRELSEEDASRLELLGYMDGEDDED